MDDHVPDYELAAHISCPSAKHTLLVHEPFNDNTIFLMFPLARSLNAIVRRYTRSPVEEIALEIKFDLDPILSCSLTFRSPDATTMVLEFRLLRSADDDEEDSIPFEDLHRTTFGRACRTIQDHPSLSNVRRLLIKYGNHIGDLYDLRRFSNSLGRLFKSMGPLDVLSMHGCDPHFYLTPFLDFPASRNMEEPIIYPPIKALEISHPLMVYDREKCITGFVRFAKSQHTRGLPFQRVSFCMEEVPDEMAERLRPWVGAVDCYEEPYEEFV